ncbi:MAG: hypothetical protein IJH63_06745 [Methanobrevibacter sp.]|nr:hypothetical protein [Methanobrevibacter sp.]
MESLERIHDTINSIAEDPRVNVSKIDDYTFDIVIDGELMDSFDKLGEIQKKIDESCSDEFTLKTIYGDGQDAKLILEKN